MAKKPVSDQMELFEDGGFKDQGNTKDPISNNPVPVGSTKKEVRDDIPANLSEGEFVLPADVVRYHGLEKIMGFRDQAKQGLEKMENMGQMGNSDQATIPDGVPFQQMAEGGAVPVPTIQQPEVVAQNQVPGVQYVAPTTQAVRPSIYSFNQQMPQVTVPTQPSVTVPTQPNYQTPAYRQSTSTAETPKFSNLLGTQFGQLQESVTKRYVNDAGEEMYIPFVNGEPIYPIPNGFREEAEDAIKKEDEDVNKAVQSTSVRQQESDDDGDSGGFDASSTQDYKVAMQLSGYNENEKSDADKSLLGKLMSTAKQVASKLPLGAIVDGMTPDYTRQAGFNFPADVTEASALTENKKDPSYLDLLAKQSGYTSLDAMTKQYGVEPTFKFGTKPGDVSLVTGKPYNSAGQSDNNGAPAFASWEDWTNNLAASSKSGWAGGYLTDEQIADTKRSQEKRYGGTWDGSKAKAHQVELDRIYGRTKDDDDSKTKKGSSVIGSGKTDITSKVKDVKPDASFFSPSDVGTGNIKTYDPVTTAVRESKIFGRAGERKSNVLPSKGTIRDDASRVGTTFTTPSGIDNSIYQTNDGDSGSSDGGGSQPDSSSSSDMGFSTASGGFIQKKNLPKANKKKQGGLASRR